MSNACIDLPTLASLPAAEDAVFEFKSSATPIKDLSKKLACAVSAFANSGGGTFVAGVGGNGDADGGLPPHIGRQDIRDWVDQVVHQVKPTPKYRIVSYSNAHDRGFIDSSHLVLAVIVDESHNAPHMAPDGRYYIRAGAHTTAASHFIVEALWASRHAAKPRLTHAFRNKPECWQVVQLGIVSLTSSPAIEVEIMLAPLGELLKQQEEYFPLKLPLVDLANPFFFDVSTWMSMKEQFGEVVDLSVAYKDLAGNQYRYETTLDIERSFGPLQIGGDVWEKVERSLSSIDKTLKTFGRRRKQ